jgi:hypothetical protein
MRFLSQTPRGLSGASCPVSALAAVLALGAAASASAAAAPALYSQNLQIARELPPLGSSRPTPVFFSSSTVTVFPPQMGDKLFAIDVYVNSAHRDDRLKADETFDAASSWSPALEIENAFEFVTGGEGTAFFTLSVGPPPWVSAAAAAAAGLAPNANATANTWVTGTTRFRFRVSFEPDLREFPADSIPTGFTVRSLDWPEDSLQFLAAPGADQTVIPDENPPGWTVASPSAAVARKTVTASGVPFSIVTVSFTLKRIPRFYMSKFYTSIFLLVGMALVSPFMRGDDKMRVGVVHFVITCLIAWQILLAIDDNARLPATRWFSRLELLMNVAYAAVFAVYVWNALRYGWFKSLSNLMGKISKRDGSEYVTVGVAHNHHSKMQARHGHKPGHEHAGAAAEGGPSAGLVVAEAPEPVATSHAVAPEDRNRLGALFFHSRGFILFGVRGSWEHLSAHRKLDIIAASSIAVVGLAVAAAVLTMT